MYHHTWHGFMWHGGSNTGPCMWQASAAPTKPHPQPLEPDSYLPVVYMQEAVDQPRDRQREPKERKNGKKRGKSEEKAGGWCISGGGGVGAFGSKG